jgi:hypothetical protein
VQALFLIYESHGVYLWLSALLLVFVLVLWLAALHRRVSKLRRTYAALVTGADGKNLGELLSMYVEQMRLAGSKAEQLSRTSDRLESQVRSSIQRLELVRFNAYEGIGGEQSFALALLDELGDGVVISSLQGRGENRLYAKPINRWDSTHTLSAEEKEAIARASDSDVDKESHL